VESTCEGVPLEGSMTTLLGTPYMPYHKDHLVVVVPTTVVLNLTRNGPRYREQNGPLRGKAELSACILVVYGVRV